MADDKTPKSSSDPNKTLKTDRKEGWRLTGTNGGELGLRLITLASRTLLLEKEEDEASVINATLEALEAINPRDGFEGILASQMIAVHEAAMECLRRAQFPNQAFEARDMNLKHAAKLLQLYVRQVEALDKHRGKGQQKITVEHVTVQAGGQAIVGNVDAGSVDRPKAPLTPAQLEHTPELGTPLPSTTRQAAAALTPKGRKSSEQKRARP